MQTKLYINGEFVESQEQGSLMVINPADESIITTVALAVQPDIDKAIESARRAFKEGGWGKTSGKERAGYLRAIAHGIKSQRDEFARLETINNGKPLPEAEWDIDDAADCFEFYAGLAEELDETGVEEIEVDDPSFTIRAVKEPLGVAGQIIPFNFPLLMAAWKVAPALAAGCTSVLKPSDLTPLTALKLGEVAAQVKLPPGVLNIVTGNGACISEHDGVDKLAFTGSVDTGRRVMTAAARGIKPVTLELGGKSALIIFDDTEIDAAVEWTMFGVFWNKGEVCSATSRVLVHENIYDVYLARLAEAAAAIKIGPGLEKGVKMGPLVSEEQYNKVQSLILSGIESGARLVAGGKRPEGMDLGYFIEPTVFADVDTDAQIWKEEIFGPVVCVRKFSTEAEAVIAANDSELGLAGAVMSADKERCKRVASALEVGIVWTNCSQPTFTAAPWGGRKKSGIGRELGKWGLNNYLSVKQITDYCTDEPWGWYLG